MTWKVEFDEMILSNHLRFQRRCWNLHITIHLPYFYYYINSKLRLRRGKPLYHFDILKGMYKKNIKIGSQVENAWEKVWRLKIEREDIWISMI